MSEDIKALLAQASFSFVGTILHLGAATGTDTPIDDRTAVVHIDHVLHAPPAFAHLEGDQVTLQLSPTADLPAAGESFAFFAQGLAFGRTLTLAEVGRLPVDAVEPHATAAVTAGATAGAFAPLVEEMRQSALRDHAGTADVVLLGRVIGIEKAGGHAHSEHDPDLWRATLEVFHVERGPSPGETVKVLFANSQDVRWRTAPKPRASQGGLWILHATTGERRDLAPFEILHPEDMQATQQLDVLRA